MKNKKLFYVLLLVLINFALQACMPGSGYSSENNPAGFFTGVWHGWIAPISLIVGFFESEVRIYEIYNTGWWYDLGFYASIISGFGGLSLFRKKKEE